MASITKGILAELALGAMIAGAAADEYPSRVVRITAPMPAGGSVDTAARLVAEPLISFD